MDGKLMNVLYEVFHYPFNVPIHADYKPVTHTRDTVHIALFACYSVLAFIGIIFAVVCMVFIIVFREKM